MQRGTIVFEAQEKIRILIKRGRHFLAARACGDGRCPRFVPRLGIGKFPVSAPRRSRIIFGFVLAEVAEGAAASTVDIWVIVAFRVNRLQH